MERKYEKYYVKTTYNNGAVGYTKTGHGGLTTWKAMLDQYNKVKNSNKNNSCIVEFIGTTKDKKDEVIYSKEINMNKQEDKLKVKAKDYVEQIQDIIKTLELKKEYHLDNLDACNKKEDYVKHEIEFSEDDIDEKDMIYLFKKMKKASKARRVQKKELAVINGIDYDAITLGLLKAKEEITKDKCGVKFSKATEDKYNIIKEIYYKSEKERIHYISQLKSKFDRTIVDEVNKKITFYNKGYTRSSNKK